ncbi:MAG TPA: hypothetical protein VMU71_08235 [Terracidiphilus sp.]|nr:hypothetical protein [Terracidiphilus sp.]
MPMLVMNQQLDVAGRLLRTARVDGDGYQFLSDPEALVAELRRRPDRPDLLTFVERVNVTERRYPFPMEWDNYAVIPVTTFENYFRNQIQTVARNRARQAGKRGVELREVEFSDELVRGIWEIYNESPLRQGRPYPHYGKSLETVYREEATFLDRAAFTGAYFEGELIGFIKLVWDDQKVQGALMNILSKLAQRDKSPTNALVCEAVKMCERRGLSHLVYSHYGFAGKTRDNLSDFKDKTGFKRVDVPRYWVPLSAWGRMAMGMGLHRRWRDRLPEGLGNKLRGLRADWYQWRHRAAKAGA